MAGKEETLASLKMNELCGNVIENKGARLENRWQSRHVIENKDSYALKAVILLKTKEIDSMS
jgi:hypothetical protein